MKIIKYLSVFFFFFCIFYHTYSIFVEIDKKQLDKQKNSMNLALIYMPENEPEHAHLKLQEVSNLIAKALSYSKQFMVTVKGINAINTKEKIKDLFDKGFALAIFLNFHDSNKDTIEWRLYDTFDCSMLCGKKLINKNNNLKDFSYSIADQLWQSLTEQKSSFSSKLAYIKKIEAKNNKKSIICTCDYDGTNEDIAYKIPGTYLGLYWDNNINSSRLLCSEFTRHNVRLISINNNKKNILLDLKGTCVGISLSPDNNQAVYCRSGDIWYHRYYPNLKKSIHQKLISNDGKNFYPTLLPNGDILFCSDSKNLTAQYPKASGPQICYFKTADKSIELITKEGYCIAPAYCATNNKISYSKKVNGYFQICIYDLKTKQHKQITSSKCDKIDSCWSPCGNYIAFCCKKGKNSQIATLNLNLRTVKFLTKPDCFCDSPAWSNTI